MISTLLLVDTIGLPTSVAFVIAALSIAFCGLFIGGAIWFLNGGRGVQTHRYESSTYPRFDED